MLNSLYIKNFRLFEELSLEKIGEINLVVGRNNSGKSCLLEALYFYAQRASSSVLNELIKKRGQDWESKRQWKYEQPSQEINDPFNHPFRHLFYGYHFPQIGADSIEIGPLRKTQDRIKLHISAYQHTETPDGHGIVRIDTKKLLNNGLEDIEIVLELEESGNLKPISPLNSDSRFYFRSIPQQKKTVRSNVQFVPTRQLDHSEVAYLWDNINLYPNLRKEVFKGLRLIDENIEEVVKVGEHRETTFILIYKNSNERIPLNSLGDGINHLFQIILGLVNANKGILLIDEFENGLHYDVQPKVWDLIFELSKKLQVQVFATTHSWDCINAFQKSVQKHSTGGMLVHLGQSALKSKQGKVIATLYDKEELQLITQADLEVR